MTIGSDISKFFKRVLSWQETIQVQFFGKKCCFPKNFPRVMADAAFALTEPFQNEKEADGKHLVGFSASAPWSLFSH